MAYIKKITMVTITEDYVSFETAKLLKEKGFPQEYDIYHSLVYNEEDYKDEYEVQRMVLETKLVKAGTLSSYPVSVPEPKCYCCTLQMAMKWLRYIHDIIIDPEPVWNGKKWEYLLFVVTPQNADSPYYEHNPYKSYEECVEASLKYCLKNLI